MGLLDFFKKKEKKTVVKQTTTVINKHTTVVMHPVSNNDSEPDSIQTIIKNKYDNILVCLDPGHAISTPGKKSPYTLNGCMPALDFCEYKFNRLIVNMLSDMLEKQGIETFITTTEKQDGETDVKLSVRAQRAWNRIKKTGKQGIFISIHANANGKGTAWDNAKGWSAYTTKRNNISDRFSECLYDQAELMFKPKKYTIRVDKQDGDRDWEENFTVIFSLEELSKKKGQVTVPCVLTENFFYTNIKDAEYILSKEGMNDITNVHFNAILQFIENEFNIK